MFTATLLVCSCLYGFGSSDEATMRDYGRLRTPEEEGAVIKASSLSPREKGEQLAVFIKEGMTIDDARKILGIEDGEFPSNHKRTVGYLDFDLLLHVNGDKVEGVDFILRLN